MSRIAILGWGSLIWDLELLTPHATGNWLMEAGPRLPMEFSRISPKRKLGLVVCLDPSAGVECTTNVIQSTKSEISHTIDDLAARERAPLNLIGAVHRNGLRKGRMPDVCKTVAEWCNKHGWDGAVWTDLEPNFFDHTNQVFTIDAGLAYLHTLTGENLIEAHKYIESAPNQTQTPLRDALAKDAWWQGLKENGQS
ncbi:MAG: hypothetical protein JKY41_02420 [Rhodobacteraceae bacterium]|nr:hypothetical protein [Paracoccaceae bacterium]